jgi:dsDNA-specific endonuclease/ATPase MutS2
MNEFVKISQDLKKNLKSLQDMNNQMLKTIQEQEPEKVNELLNDNNALIKALNNQDVNAVMNIHKKYADKNNK